MSSASGKFSRLRTKNRPSYDSFRSTNSMPRAPKFDKSGTDANAFLLSQADAEWYLELPETIRRKHFSRDERTLLATKCESIIVDAADEAIYRMGRHANQSLDTLNSQRTSIADSTESSCDVEALNCVEEIRKSFRWLDEDGALDLRLDEYYSPASNKHETDPPQPRSSVRGTPSISSKTHRTHSSLSSLTTRPSLGLRRQTSHGMNVARHQPSFSQCSNPIDTDAAYYQDPEARLKLRVYLASPQKFDEAVEFGFPSTTDSKGFINCRPRTATARKLESESSDQTPTEGTPHPNDLESVSMNVENAMDYQKLRELQDRAPSAVASSKTCSPVLFDPYPHTSAGNREMTLRMTLTRKDLRADENELYGWKKDPLALEDLPPASDSDACHFDWGNVGKSSDSGLKKLWRRVRGFR